MPQYGVWLEREDAGPGIATLLEAGQAPPEEADRHLIQSVWRGTAKDADAALRAARAEWDRQYPPGTPGGDCEVEACVEEILPGDSGYVSD